MKSTVTLRKNMFPEEYPGMAADIAKAAKRKEEEEKRAQQPTTDLATRDIFDTIASNRGSGLPRCYFCNNDLKLNESRFILEGRTTCKTCFSFFNKETGAIEWSE